MFDERKFKSKLVEKGFTLSDIARMLGINETTLYRKIKGISDFSRNEMSIIKKELSLNTFDFENIFFASLLTETQI